MVAYGGYTIATGGADDSYSVQLVAFDTSVGPTATAWGSIPASNVPDQHFAHRLIEYGGILYMMGGLTQDSVKGARAMIPPPSTHPDPRHPPAAAQAGCSPTPCGL